MGPFQSSAEGLGLRLTEHSKCWYHVIGHNSKAIWRFVKKIYGIYRHPPPSPFPSLPSSSFAFIAFHVTSSFFLLHLPHPPHLIIREPQGGPLSLCPPCWDPGRAQPAQPAPQAPVPPPAFWDLTLAISFPFLFMQM